jgi:uncharacterized membrane protein
MPGNFIERAEFNDLQKLVNTTAQMVAGQQQQIVSLQQIVATLVSRAEFTPVKMIAYGLATAVMSSVIMALLAKVILK